MGARQTADSADEDVIHVGLDQDGSGELVIDHGDRPKKKSELKPPKPAVAKPDTEPTTALEIKHSTPQAAKYPEMIVGSQPLQPVQMDGQNHSTEIGVDEQKNRPASIPREPEKNVEARYIESSPSLSSEQVVVPGGTPTSVPDPSVFFRSRYRNRHVPHPSVSSRNTPGYPAAYPPRPSQFNPGMATIPAHMLTKASVGKPAWLKLIVGAGGLFGLVVLILLVFVLPNSPEKVYSSAMERTAKGVDNVQKDFVSSGVLARFGQTEITGTMNAATENDQLKGTFNGSTNSSVLYLALEGTDNNSKNFNVNIISKARSPLQSSAMFVKYGGDAGVIDSYGAGISQYSNKWVSFAPNDFNAAVSANVGPYKALFPALDMPLGDQQSYKPDSIADPASQELLGILLGTLKDFAFKTEGGLFADPQLVDKPKVNGVGTYHYSVVLEKSVYADYCKKQTHDVLASEGFVVLTGLQPDKLAALTQSVDTYCEESAAKAGESKSYEIWVDKKRKTIYQLRSAAQSDPENYIQTGFGQSSDDAYDLKMTSRNGDGQPIVGYLFQLSAKKSQIVIERVVTTPTDDQATVSSKIRLELKPAESSSQPVALPSPEVNAADVLKSSGTDLLHFLSPPNSGLFF